MKILIAEDEPTQRALLRATLIKRGYEVEAVSDGESAWKVLQRSDAPQLVLLDWMMPGTSGPEVCRRLRQRSDAPYVYVILLTAMDNLDDMIEGMQSGADDYISKPFDARALEARLRAGIRILTLQSELLNAQKMLEFRASHDPLTGIWNRRAVLDRLCEELARVEREATSSGVIMADIDYFKQVNDRYGHLAGDEVLQAVAQRMKATLRPYDFLGRYGGEEFLIVLPGCDGKKAYEAAQRIRNAVCAAPVRLSSSVTIPVTLSLGVTACPCGKKVEAVSIIEPADRALYLAKNGGRNRVEWLPEAASAEA